MRVLPRLVPRGAAQVRLRGAVTAPKNDPRRHDRYLIREGYVFGGVTAGLLLRWSLWAFLAWFVLAFALWLYDLLRHP